MFLTMPPPTLFFPSLFILQFKSCRFTHLRHVPNSINDYIRMETNFIRKKQKKQLFMRIMIKNMIDQNIIDLPSILKR